MYHKMPTSSWLCWLKNDQILESNFGNLKNWKTSCYLSNFKFSGVICDKFWLKFKLIWNKNLFSEGIYHEKTGRGSKLPPSTCKIGLSKILVFKIFKTVFVPIFAYSRNS